jgi:hypothetical protein
VTRVATSERMHFALAPRERTVIFTGMRFVVMLVGLCVPLLGHAEVGPQAAVKGYFQALGRQDFGKALSLTDGDAQARTSHMVSTLQSQAAAAHARVEVQVKKVELRETGALEPGRGVPVCVQFHIDVVGKKYCFAKVARRLEGEAKFWVDPNRSDKIVAIDGNID